MLKLNVTHLLKEKGKSKYWLYMQMGMSYTNFNKMINHQTKGIQYQTIENLCTILECSPNELIVFEEKNNCT